jgi:hypothetical protein
MPAPDLCISFCLMLLILLLYSFIIQVFIPDQIIEFSHWEKNVSYKSFTFRFSLHSFSPYSLIYRRPQTTRHVQFPAYGTFLLLSMVQFSQLSTLPGTHRPTSLISVTGLEMVSVSSIWKDVICLSVCLIQC